MFTFSTKLWYNKQSVSKKDGCVSLYLQVYIGSRGKRETNEFKLRLRWPADKIDLNSSKLLPRQKQDSDVNDYNLIIMDERGKHNEIAKIFRLSGGFLNMEEFTRQLRIFDDRRGVIAYINRKRKELRKERLISESNYKNVGSTIGSIKQYSRDVRFDEIDTKWIERYKAWLSANGKKKSTIWGRIKDLKRYLNLASKEKTIFVDPEVLKFPNPPVIPVTIYLNREELKRMIALQDDLILTGTELSVLKAFLFTCFTSLRISDLYRAGENMLVSKNMLSFIAKKGDEKTPKYIRIPLIPIAKSLINESLKSFFQLPTEQDYNRKLKKLARMAGINKKLTSHVGRHTYGYIYMTTIGNLYGLKEILGHSNIETTLRYAHLDEEYQMEQAMLMQKGFEEMVPKTLQLA